MNFIPEHLLRRHELQGQCRAIHNVGTEDVLARLSGPDGYMAHIREGKAALVARIGETITRAVREGAEAVLLGCTCMSPIAATLARSAPVPVINPLEEAVRAALVARPPAPPNLAEGRREAIRAMVDAVAGMPAEDCDICLFGEDEA